MKRSEVGYGKPPAEHRFQPGQSGNPAGRKQGSKNMLTLMRNALEQKVVVNDGRKRRTVSKLEAAFIQQSNRAAAGDLKAMQQMVSLLMLAEAQENAKTAGLQISPEERRAFNLQVIAGLRVRLDPKAQKDG